MSRKEMKDGETVEEPAVEPEAAPEVAAVEVKTEEEEIDIDLKDPATEEAAVKIQVKNYSIYKKKKFEI
jgi:hypothetical protein